MSVEQTLRPGQVAPEELLMPDGMNESRAEIIYSAFYTSVRFCEYAAEQGHEIAGLDEAGLDGLDKCGLLSKQLATDKSLRALHETWRYERYREGFTRLFGYHAVRHSLYQFSPIQRGEVIPERSGLVYAGELPQTLVTTEPNSVSTEHWLQMVLDSRYGKSEQWIQMVLDSRHGKRGVIPTSRPSDMLALYEDLTIAVRPIAHTAIQMDIDKPLGIWHGNLY